MNGLEAIERNPWIIQYWSAPQLRHLSDALQSGITERLRLVAERDLHTADPDTLNPWEIYLMTEIGWRGEQKRLIDRELERRLSYPN
jgi:hypothetical protein